MNYVCRNLISAFSCVHKQNNLKFTFWHFLPIFVFRAKQEIEYSGFIFLLTGGVGLQNTIPNPDPSWLQDKSWDEICRADELSGLHGIK